jgi:hypothetical protein
LPIRLRQRLPIIPIPLLPADRAERIALQQNSHQFYDAAGYEDFIYCSFD